MFSKILKISKMHLLFWSEMAELVSYSCKEQKITKQRRGFSLFHFDSALRRLGGGRDMLLLMEDDLGSWFL